LIEIIFGAEQPVKLICVCKNYFLYECDICFMQKTSYLRLLCTKNKIASGFVRDNYPN